MINPLAPKRRNPILHSISSVIHGGLMGSISLRLDDETLKRLNDLSSREGKDRSTLIRELLDKGIRGKDLDDAVSRYARGEVTAWRAAQLAGMSLWNFMEVLGERGVIAQYSELDLERDLEALRE